MKPSPSTILIVDDEPHNLDVLDTCLQESGFKVLVATDGEQALKRVSRIKPDLILLDVKLPGIDGFETFRRLKATDAARDVPVIFITAGADVEAKVRGLESGAVDYITKPFHPEEVVARINKHLTICKLQRQLAEQNARLEQEIAERKQAEEKLGQSAARWRSLTETSPDHILMLDTDLNIQFANFASPGLTVEELIGTPLYTYVEEEQQAGIKAILEGVLSTGEAANYETTYDMPDGSVIYYESRATPRRMPQSGELGSARDIVGLTISARDITERVRIEAIRWQSEDALRRRNRDLELLNQASQLFNSTLDLDRMLGAALEKVRRSLNITACSIWLVSDQNTDPAGPSQTGSRELVCWHATRPHDDVVRGWRLAMGEGIAGWVAHHGESLNVPDTRIDSRHFKEIDRIIGIELVSVLSVPLKIKKNTIGVFQVGDTTSVRFDSADLVLVESLASVAAVAIENTRLYEQANQDAKTRAILLQEVNHRVKNSLATITGIIYIEQSHAQRAGDERSLAAVMDDLANRIKGLSTVHQMLSDSNWSPLPLRELTRQVIDSALQGSPPGRYVLLDVFSTAPVVLGPKEAHNMAIVINELSTNVIKYATPPKETTQITVRIAPEPDGETVLFEFRDDGPGFPEAVLQSDGHNVGLYLVENTVCYTLHGEITLHNDNGAVVTIRFPQGME